MEKAKKRSLWADVCKRILKNRAALIGFVLLLILALLAAFADVIAGYEEVAIAQNLELSAQGPSLQHILGNDELGRDIFARIIHGARISLLIGIISVFFALILGGAFGAAAGYFGGKLDNVLMRFMDIFLAIPSTLLSIAIVSAFGKSMLNLVIAVGASTIPSYARIVRASVLTLRDQEFIEAARAIGAGNFHIIMRHIMPNSLAPIIVQSTLGVASAILSISGLSFIGLGIESPTPEWGAMLAGGRDMFRNAWHIATFPGIFIMLSILSLNLLGDGLRDALDPKLKQ